MTTPARSSLILRSLYALAGVVIIGWGAAVLRVGLVGVDPYTAFNAGAGTLLGWGLGPFQLLANLVLFVPVLIWGRRYIGVGTVINMVLTGFFIDWFTAMLQPILPHDGQPATAVAYFLVGIAIFDFGASAYMSADVGIAPYDALAPMIVDRTKLSYKAVRVPQALLFLGAALLVRGPVGLGTVMTAFFNGPLIEFFSRSINQPLVARLTGDPGRPAARTSTPGDDGR